MLLSLDDEAQIRWPADDGGFSVCLLAVVPNLITEKQVDSDCVFNDKAP